MFEINNFIIVFQFCKTMGCPLFGGAGGGITDHGSVTFFISVWFKLCYLFTTN